jgi:hypothetical protein
MATSTWRGALPGQIAPVQPWVETYRAALLESDPQRQLQRISEALRAMDYHLKLSGHDQFELQAMGDAREILRQLQDESLNRAQTGPWLL